MHVRMLFKMGDEKETNLGGFSSWMEYANGRTRKLPGWRGLLFLFLVHLPGLTGRDFELGLCEGWKTRDGLFLSTKGWEAE